VTDINTALGGMKIGFIGTGNMAKAIIAGLLRGGLPATQFIASAKSEQSKQDIQNTLAIQVGTNTEVASQSDIVILSVKPQVLKHVCDDIKESLDKRTLVISVAAGITCDAISLWLSTDNIVRAMPNTPSAIGAGATGLYALPSVSPEQKGSAQYIMRAVGIAEFVETEPLIDAVTAISASAPAYFFLFMEAMIESGVRMGLDREIAEKFAIQTALGAAQLAHQSEHSIEALRKMVTSPKGTTEQALKCLENGNLRTLVDEAMQACVSRAQELSKELSNQK